MTPHKVVQYLLHTNRHFKSCMKLTDEHVMVMDLMDHVQLIFYGDEVFRVDVMKVAGPNTQRDLNSENEIKSAFTQRGGIEDVRRTKFSHARAYRKKLSA